MKASALSATSPSPAPGLVVRGLCVGYRSTRGMTTALRDLNLDIAPGEVVGIVGESGSGKSTLAYALVRYLSANAEIVSGSVKLAGEDILAATPRRLEELRGAAIGMVYQDPATALNPTMRLGRQLTEGIKQHDKTGTIDLAARAAELLGMVHVADPQAIMQRFPHEISGGERQRVLIAMAFASQPKLLIFDEATSALDATTAVGIVDLIRRLQKETQVAVMYITHDLASVAELAQKICVLYGGRMVETGTTEQVLGEPRHPYTRLLIGSRPDPFVHMRGRHLGAAGARGAKTNAVGEACNFRQRCAFARPECAIEPAALRGQERHLSACIRDAEVNAQPFARPAAAASIADDRPDDVLLSLQGIRVRYGRRHLGDQLLGRPDRQIEAVRGIDLTVRRGQTLGLVGESGCGKSTLARTFVGLGPFDGTIRYGDEVIQSPAEMTRAYRRNVQLIFQNPDVSLNPRIRVAEIVGRPLKLYGLDERGAGRRQVEALLESVQLPPSYASRYTHQLSGGEKQRVAIARAFAANPQLVICDEITSSLDVSVQASILDLLLDLQSRHGTAYVFISHDLNVVQAIADEIAVMYLGRIVERRADAGGMIGPPFHPYTETLLSAVPVADTSVITREVRPQGPLPSPANPPAGCGFSTRCPRRLGQLCEKTPPPRQMAGSDHEILCHISVSELSAVAPIWSRAEA